jgi:hypothetical protein
MSVPDWLDSAAGYATCNILTSAGSALVGTGVATLAAGGGGVVPLTLGSLSLLAAGAACQPTAVDGTEDPPQFEGCTSMAPGGKAQLQIKGKYDSDFYDMTGTNYPDNDEVTELVSVEQVPGSPFWESRLTYKTTAGQRVGGSDVSDREEAEAVRYRLRPLVGTCDRDAGDPVPYPPDFHDPIPYTDPNTNCTYNISLQGFSADVLGGEASPVFKIEAAPAPQVLASGGVVGGCNFSPIIYQQPPGGGGPPRIGPWDPTWPDWDGSGTPPWLPFLTTIAAPFVPYIIDKVVDAVFKAPVPPYTYTFRAACNYKQDGSYETYTITLPEQPWETRVLAMQEMNIDFLQQHLLWKTPTCSGGGSSVSGDPVTINWVSDEYSSAGGNRLRKLLTYFDQVGSTLEQTVAHWRDFSWQAGPVIVSVNDVPLGKPQVWAASVDEGKRVINHAASIAGVDMTNAAWMVMSPRSSRYGETGTMRVHRSRNGTLGITKRDGPSGLPPALT